MDNTSNRSPDEIITQMSREDADVAERILEWSKRYFSPRPNPGLDPGSIRLEFRRTPTRFHPINITSDGKLVLQMRNIIDALRFKEDAPEFRRQLSQISGIIDNPDYPYIELDSLAEDQALKKFKDLMEWLVGRLRKS